MHRKGYKMTDHQLIDTKLIKNWINGTYGNTITVSVTKQKRAGYTLVTVKVIESTVPMRNPDHDLRKAVELMSQRKEAPSSMLRVYSDYAYEFIDNIRNFMKIYHPYATVCIDIPVEVGIS